MEKNQKPESDLEAAVRRAAEGVVEKELDIDSMITQRWHHPDKVAAYLHNGTDG